MLKKLLMGVAGFTMVFVFMANDANARVNKCCNTCEHVRVPRIRCPKPKCPKPHHHHCQADCGTVVHASTISSCSGVCGCASHHLVPVADPGPVSAVAPSSPAPAEAVPAPSPSAAEPAE